MGIDWWGALNESIASFSREERLYRVFQKELYHDIGNVAV
jgi:hypothetical protein